MKNEEIKIEVKGEFAPEQIWLAFKSVIGKDEIKKMWKQAYNNYLKRKK